MLIQPTIRRMVFTLALTAATTLTLTAPAAYACPEVVFDSQTGAAQTQADLRDALAQFEEQVAMADAS